MKYKINIANKDDPLFKEGFTVGTLLTATVTISAPDAFTAFAVSEKFLYFPVPTINLDLKL